MGYYSDVALVLSKEAHEKLKEAVKEASGDVRTLFNKYRERLAVDQKTGSAMYYWEGIKWYSTDPEFQFLENFLDGLEDGQCRFLRLGEDFGDLEEYGSFHDNPFEPRVTARIAFNKIGEVYSPSP